MKFILTSKWIAIVLLVISAYFLCQIPSNRQRIVFNNSAKAVQDSMLVLRKICESVEPKEFMNCFTVKRDSIVIFRRKSLGKIDSISVFNEGFKGMKRVDIAKLLSTLKYLNRNDISGIYHDTSIGFWLYGYKDDDLYSDIHSIRHIYLWNTSEDTLSPAFNYYFKILDRKEHMLLVSNNDVRYRKF